MAVPNSERLMWKRNQPVPSVDCIPISHLYSPISHLKPKSAFVVNEETRKPWSTTNLMLGISYSRHLHDLDREITEDRELPVSEVVIEI